MDKELKRLKRLVVAEWIEFKQISEDEYLVVDLLEDAEEAEDAEENTVSAEIFQFAKKLDGKTSPYKIDPEKPKGVVDLYLAILESYGVLRDKRYLSKEKGDIHLTVLKTKTTTTSRMVALALNTLLMISFLPVFLLSINKYLMTADSIVLTPNVAGMYLSLIVGTTVHEIAHYLACIGYGGSAFEIGVFLQYVIPGAYVLINPQIIKKRLRRVQVFAAGIEADLLLTGIYIFIACRFDFLNSFFMSAALVNIVNMFLNLAFFKGVDGTAVIGDLLGAEEIYSQSRVATSKYKWKKYLKNMGIHGKAVLFVSYLFRVIQIFFPLMIISGICVVVIWAI